MENQALAFVPAELSVEIAEGERREEMRSDMSALSGDDAFYVRDGPRGCGLPGAPTISGLRLYLGGGLTWNPETYKNSFGPESPDERRRFHCTVILYGLFILMLQWGSWLRESGNVMEARRTPELVAAIVANTFFFVAAVLAIVQAALNLKGGIIHRRAESIELPPSTAEDIWPAVQDYLDKVRLEPYHRIARVLLEHPDEVHKVLGEGHGLSMLEVAQRMYERADFESRRAVAMMDRGEFPGDGQPPRGLESDASTGDVYLEDAPDYQRCGLYNCWRCGKSRQMRLNELYTEWDPRVIFLVVRVEIKHMKEEARLLEVKRAELAKLRYGKWWVFSFSKPMEYVVFSAVTIVMGMVIIAGVMSIYKVCKSRGG